MGKYNCIVVLGATACGKTRLACQLAYALGGEIISADSRQVYKHLNIGTGKDLNEYAVNGRAIIYYLIDICEPDKQFYLNDFMSACQKAFDIILGKNKVPIICGGTGLYLDSLRKDFSYTQIKEDDVLRDELGNLATEELIERLKKFSNQNKEYVDLNSKKRLIRAIEVAKFLEEHPGKIVPERKMYRPYYIQINVSEEERKKLITDRLLFRMNNGLIEEVENLLKTGVTHERLQFLGLEYKFVSLYLQNKMSKHELITKLQTAIFQFAKRQMTWFRKMEKDGVKMHKFEKGNSTVELIKSIKPSFAAS